MISEAADRRWNDNKDKDSLKKGNFTEDEVHKLMHALCEFAAKQSEPEQVISALCTKSKSDLPKELYGAWPKIAEVLPDRTVQSCHNVCRRRFNPSNYSGPWTKEEEDILKRLVSKHGNAWQAVASQFNQLVSDPARTRTAGNVKDKFKQLGGEYAVQRNVGPWSIQEALMLVQLVIKATDGRILKKSRELVFSQNKEQKEERFKFNADTGKLTIYHADKVRIDEILPLLIKPKRARKHF